MANLLIDEDVADHRVKADFFADGGGKHAEVVDELLEVFPHLAFREDRTQGPEVISG